MSQLLTLFWLRYVVFKNSLTSRREVATTVFNLLVFSGYLLFWTGIGAGLFLAVVYFQEFRDFVMAAGMSLLLGILLFMMLITQSTGSSSHFDPRRYILFPVALGKLFALNLVSALSEIVLITVLPAVAGMLFGLGIALHNPLAGLIAFICATLWIDGLFVFIGLLTAWLLAGRKRRTEIFFGVLIGVMVVGGQVLPRMAGTRWGRAVWEWVHPYLGFINEVLAWTPLSVWSFFFEHLHRGDVAGAYARLLSVSALFIGLLWAGGYAVFTRLATSARASSSQGARGSDAPLSAPARRMMLKLPFIPEQISVIFAKDLIYLTRNTATYINMLSALVITLFAFGRSTRTFGRGFSNEVSASADWWDGLRIVLWVAYAFTPSLNLFINLFGFDAAGFRQYLLAPVSWRHLLLGKNMVMGLMAGVEIALILLGAQLLYQDLTLGKVYIAVCATIITTALYSMVGNFISVNFPVRAEFGIRTRRASDRSSATNIIAVFGLMIGSAALLALPFGLGYLFQNLMLKYYVLAALAVMACMVYALRLDGQSRQLEKRRFDIAEALTRKTEKI